MIAVKKRVPTMKLLSILMFSDSLGNTQEVHA